MKYIYYYTKINLIGEYMVTYSESGVDIDLEAVTVSKLASTLKPTLKNREILTESGHFAALVPLGDKAIAMSTDGVGSKILIAEMMEKYDTVGIDCIAMVVNDILCVGAEPIALVDYLAVEAPDPDRAEEIAKGLVEGANQSNIAIIGGETASLPGIIKDFDLAGTGIGYVDKDKIITGENIKEGVGFKIDNLPEPQDIFKFIYSQDVPIEEMYRVFNMGIGFVVISSKEDSEKILNELNKTEEAYEIGQVISEDKITIKTFEHTEIEY